MTETGPMSRALAAEARAAELEAEREALIDDKHHLEMRLADATAALAEAVAQREATDRITAERDEAVERARVAEEKLAQLHHLLAAPGGLSPAELQREGLSIIGAAGPEKEKQEDRVERLEAALRELVRLKDGPRDAAYEEAKPRAWAEARAALAGSEEGDSDHLWHCPAATRAGAECICQGPEPKITMPIDPAMEDSGP